MRTINLVGFLCASLAFLLGCSSSNPALTLLNVSYDPTREFYQDFNAAFLKHWKETKGQDIEIKQSHGGSGKQARAVIDGLEADVVTLALAYDIDAIAEKGLIDKEWQKRLPNQSAPYFSTIVFLVRKGNPKSIKDWSDLIQPGLQVITPNPKTSGGARWNYLAAYGYALKTNNNDEAKATEFVSKLFQNTPVLGSGARDSTTSFIKNQLGDVLLAWENEALLVKRELSADDFEIVYPSMSILAEPPVSVVDKAVEQHKNRELAQAYLEYLSSEEGQKLAAKHYFRPRLESAAKANEGQFPKITLFTIDELFGGWQKAQPKHFADGGVFDSIYKVK